MKLFFALLGACTVPSITAQPTSPQPTSAPQPDTADPGDWPYMHLRSLLGMKVDDATAQINSWHRGWTIRVNLVGAGYISNQDYVHDCAEGIVCGVNYREVGETTDTVVLDVRGKPDVGAPPPPP